MTATPVGLSRDLPERRVMRADVDGQDVAIWRGPDGDIHAWNNRCPHRGMRLSHGFVRGDKLACLYHGWHYGKDGGCTYIPAHPDLDPPETIRATAFAVFEKGGVIWVDTGGDVDAEPVVEGMDPLRTISVATSKETMLAACARTPHGTDMPQSVAPGLLQIGARRLAVHTAALGDQETLVHVLIDSGASVAARKALSRWCEAARHLAEANGS